MTNLIITHSIIVEFYTSRDFIFYEGLIKKPKGYSGAETKNEYNRMQNMKGSFYHFLLQILRFEIYGPISIINRITF